MSDRDHIAALKAAADPDRVAAALGLKGRGRRFFCPVCQPDGGKTPDLSVQDKGFTCFKCGLKGDLLGLVEVAGGLTFPDAVAFLERETGLAADPRRRGPGKPKTPTRPRRTSPSADPPGIDKKKNEPDPDPDVLSAFLGACRPVEGQALDWLTRDKGVAPDVVAALGLRFCGREYLDILAALKDRFGEDALVAAGLLKQARGRLSPTFGHYYAKKTGFLVVPYLLKGRPVYLKVRPPCGKDKAEALGLIRFLNSAAAVPCLYNVDALVAADPPPDKVLICEGESDTWTALSAGFAAVGSPGARLFKPQWVELFRDMVEADLDEERAAVLEYEGGLSRAEAERQATTGTRSKVYLVLDADVAGTEGSRTIAGLFQKAGLPVPLRLAIPEGQDLTDYMQAGKKA